MFNGLRSGLCSRVQPVLIRSKSVFCPTTATYTNKQASAPIKPGMADSVFILKEYNNVPVTAQGLEREQLAQWPPFKVSTRAQSTADNNNTTSVFLSRRAHKS